MGEQAGAHLMMILREMVDEAVAEQIGNSPSAPAMVREYGEVIEAERAAEILRVSRGTISNMTRDGRLQGVAGAVSVRSMARYLDEGKPSAQRVKRREEHRRLVMMEGRL